MLALLLLAISAQDLIPMRWGSGDPKSLEILKDTPVNCLLLERSNWSAPFLKAAADAKIQVLGVVRPAADALEAAQNASALQLPGVVMEGDFDATTGDKLRKM